MRPKILLVEDKEAKKYPKTKDLLIFGLTNYTDPKLDEELIKD
jgi:hypothetical protein